MLRYEIVSASIGSQWFQFTFAYILQWKYLRSKLDHGKSGAFDQNMKKKISSPFIQKIKKIQTIIMFKREYKKRNMIEKMKGILVCVLLGVFRPFE